MHALGRFTLAALCSLLSAVALGQEAISSRYVEPYPEAVSKKGLQVEMPDDAIALGIKHACLNINLCSLIEPKAGPSSLLFTLDVKPTLSIEPMSSDSIKTSRRFPITVFWSTSFCSLTSPQMPTLTAFSFIPTASPIRRIN